MSNSNSLRTLIRQVSPLLAALTLGVLLSACGHGGPRGGFDREGAQQQGFSEKAVIRALSAVEADEQQRLAVLAAFDRDDAERRKLLTEGEQLRRDIAKLPKSQPDYLEQLQPLARRKGEIVTEDLLIQARFDQAVASTLTPDQLEHWNELFRQSGDRGGFGGEGGGGGGRRRGGPMG